jgi:hypothetical protein
MWLEAFSSWRRAMRCQDGFLILLVAGLEVGGATANRSRFIGNSFGLDDGKG